VEDKFSGTSMKAGSPRFVATVGILAALTTVATMIIQIPTPQTRGYINLGDTMVMLSAVLFGPAVGAAAGGIGSALADLASGYAHWAPFTLVIKGIEGMIAGLFSMRRRPILTIIGTIIAGAEMVLGYFIVECFIYGLGGALAEVPGNSFQAASGIIFSNIVGKIIKKTTGVGVGY
jgi:uncharacterized membrane protein